VVHLKNSNNMSNNKSNSPFFAIGQGINNLLDYRMIAYAGVPKNFTGIAIGKIAEKISRLDFSKMSGEDPIPPEVTEVADVKIQNPEFKKLLKEQDFDFSKDQLPAKKLPKLGVLNERPPSPPPPPSPDLIGESIEKYGLEQTTLDYSTEDDYNTKIGTKIFGAPIMMDIGDAEMFRAKNMIGGGADKRLQKERYLLEQAKKNQSIPVEGDVQYGPQLPGPPRLKPEVLEIIENSRYKREGKDDTKLHRVGYFLRSPFYKTKNRPYRELAKIAESPKNAFSTFLPNQFIAGTGTGNEAIQSYNAVIESENYRRKIENEFDEDLTKEISSLNVDLSRANVTGQQRQDLLDLSLNNKKQLSEAFQKYADGKINKSEYEMLKTNLLSEVNILSSDLGLIKTKAADFLKNKDNIDLNASDPEVADFYQTAIKNPDSIRIVEINGAKYFKGTTNGGKDFQIEVGAISNGDASFLLTQKADATSFISNALKTMTAYKVEGKTAMGMGEFQLPDNTEMVDGNLVKSKIRTIGENRLISDLKTNPDMVRSLLSQYRGINYEGYQTLINQDRDNDGKTTSQEIQQNEQEMLLQLAEEMYDEFVGPQYNPQSKTTRMNTQGGGTKLTQSERDRKTRDAYIASLPNPTQENFGDYRDIIGKDFTYTIEDGTLKIKKQNQKEGFSSIKLNDPKFKDFIKKFVDPNLTTTKLGTQNNTQVTNTGDTSGLRNKYNY